ncbi:MAG: exopolysaccharide transport family protein [Micropepsaceae bacterium]
MSAAMTPYSGAQPLRRAAMRAPLPPVLLEPQRPGDDGIDLKGLIDILRRRWRAVLLPALLLTGLAVVYTMMTPKLYTASTLVLLDPRDQKLLQTEVLPTGAGSDASLVESQLRVVTSNAVLGRVVEKLALANKPEFGGAGSNPIDRAASALDTLSKRVAVSRADRTYILDIRATSRDPALARDIANAITEAYREDQIDSARAATRAANEALTARLEDLRRQLRVAEDAVQAWRAEHGLVGKDGSAVTEQQIAELNQRLIAARAVMATARARYEEIRRAGADGTAQATSSQLIATLRAQLATARQKEAELTATYGDKHPQVIQIREEIASIERQIAGEVGRIAESARNDLAVAEREVAALEAELDRLTGRDVEDASALIQLRELQREADAVREVYESILARVRETAEQEQLEVSPARVLAPAATPSAASFPPRAFIVGVALAFGLGLGAALALMRERFDDRIRSAAQLRRDGLEVLAVLPPYDARRRGRTNAFDYAIRLMRAELRDPIERQRERSALVVGTRSGDGAASVALNLALAAVASGERVLIIDADPATRALTELVAPSAAIGLYDVLAGRVPLMEALVGDKRSGLRALPLAARKSPTQARPARGAYERLIAQARARFDYVILVGAPLADEPDSRAIAEAADQVALVLRAQRATRADLSTALRALRVRGEKTCGIVLTMAEPDAAS